MTNLVVKFWLIGTAVGCLATVPACSGTDHGSNDGGASGGAAGSGLGAGGAVSSGGTLGAGGAVSAGGMVSSGGAVNSGGMYSDGGAGAPPELLSNTGLYSDSAQTVLSAGVEPYQPQGELWADGATKKRWILLPAGQKIDTTDMDHWVYPVGTKVWKEFAVNGKRIETRLVEKRSATDFHIIAFLWNDQNTDATAVPGGMDNALGTTHDVPKEVDCPQCHLGMPDRVLGFTALQLSGGATGLNIGQLTARNLLTKPPVAPLVIPGDAIEQPALRYLHANCGHCHNPQWPGTSLFISVNFWQETASLATVEDTVTYKSLMSKKLPVWIDAVTKRMSNRGTGGVQMPPLATEQVHAEGLATVKAWMDRLSQNFPPPPPPPGGGPCNTGLDAVFNLFVNGTGSCSSNFCHGVGAAGLTISKNDPNYTAQTLHDQLVGVVSPANQSLCTGFGLKRVEPGDPDRSLLMMKLRPGPPCGNHMPMGGAPSLSDADLKVVSDWISACTP
jgi:hypothetical protein